MQRFGLIKTSLIDFPGRVAATVFLPGCNLRCPYCHNGRLALGEEPPDGVSAPELERFLDKRRGTLGGVCVSGGEPLLSPALPLLVAMLEERSIDWKLDSNGTLPRKLAALLDRFEEHPPALIAVDLKTSFSAYGSRLGLGGGGDAGGVIADFLEEIGRRGIPWEARTTFTPRIVTPDELEGLACGLRALLEARSIPDPLRWVLQPFRPGGCLDPAWSAFAPPSDAETAEAERRIAASGFSTQRHGTCIVR